MDLEIARLRRDLRDTASHRADDLFTILGRLRAERDPRGNLLTAGLLALGDRYEPDTLHLLRRQARRLRYMAEVSDALLRSETSEAPGLFKTLQEQIGALHDAHVLGQWLSAQAESAAAASCVPEIAPVVSVPSETGAASAVHSRLSGAPLPEAWK